MSDILCKNQNNKKRKILVLTNVAFPAEKEDMDRIILSHGLFTYDLIESMDSVQEDYLGAEIIIGSPQRQYLKKAENLKWLQLSSSGADAFADYDLYATRDIILTNARGVYGIPIAEHVFAMILSFNRNIYRYERNRQRSIWNREKPIRDLYGSTLGIIGLGNIGKEVAIRGKAFGAKVIAVKRTESKCPDFVDELYLFENINKVLEQADNLVLAVPNTPETKGLLSAERIARIKPGAFVVNVGRGDAIDQDALILALKERRIAGAGLDVTSPEPLPKESPLWKMPNVIITPHVSGFSPGNIRRQVALIEENLKRYVEGKPLLNRVSFNNKY